MTSWATVEGAPFPQGVTWIEDEQAYNFALYSKHADSVTLLLYREDDVVHPILATRLDYRHHKSWRIWHCRLPKAALHGAQYYAYVVSGPRPRGRFEWHHFDPQKILLDPYAKAVFFPATFDRRAAMKPGLNDGKAPLGYLCACEDVFDWRGDERPHHESDLIIYELHVKGFTNHPSSHVSPDKQGTYAGLIQKIPYLQELGVTAVELMPVFQYDPQEGNYWGYMPLSFFAPHHGYATLQAAGTCQQQNEFRAMVKALHQAGIEVILDVVYNHTAEGDQNGPVYSFKGIDNSTYYLMSDRPWDPYENYSGTGNTLHCANRYVSKMIVDSLRYWVEEMHVDGFRFDLASIFTRHADGSIDLGDPAIFSDMASDPALLNVRLIAEPWDAAGTYQLGRNFPGIIALQWNDRFRDDVRRFVRGDPGIVGALMSRLYGSDDFFPDDPMHAYHAYQSLNYITSHDGFTLYDLVAYNEKRNWANGHHNTDGLHENYSWNCGREGDDNVPSEVMSLRKRQIKNFCCLLFLANGTPMFRAGDEFMQTQGGNNNPYNQDNTTSWLDWDRWRANQDIFRFFKGLIAFRKAHRSLSRSRFWREDIRWYGVGPTVDLSHPSHSLAFCLHGASQEDVDLYVMINAYWEDLSFTIQEGKGGPWQRVIDTSQDSPNDVCEPGAEVRLTSQTYVVKARSMVVLSRHSVSI
ncbi:MAG: glycogen debranching protein [Candidatus Entotheonellia bacterium]